MEESFESPLKRIRRSSLWIETPPLSQCMLSPSTTTTSKEEWWKKKQPRNRSDACVVCQRVLSTTTSIFQSQASSCIHDSRGMRDTSLLTYFKPHAVGEERPIVAWNSLKDAPNNPRENVPECHFCEKNVCPDCIAPCEECNYLYCKFCRTVDYDTDGFTDRILCLDCQSEKAVARSSSSSNMDDAMHIG